MKINQEAYFDKAINIGICIYMMAKKLQEKLFDQRGYCCKI